MIVREFEGKNEKEAIDKAIEDLGLDRNEIDFEIVESKRPGILFRGGKVKIRVHISEGHEEHGEAGNRYAPFESEGNDDEEADARAEALARGEVRGDGRGEPREQPRREKTVIAPQGEFEEKIIGFTRELLDKMGFPAQVTVTFREDKRLGLDIESDNSGILIGKQGKTLEALQFLVNLAGGRMGGDSTRIVLDTQDYRSRRERALIRMANHVAEQVRKNHDSQLLEPLNPFERRLIHTSLARYGDVETVSEGEGLYKRIRVIYRGNKNGREE